MSVLNKRSKFNATYFKLQTSQIHHERKFTRIKMDFDSSVGGEYSSGGFERERRPSEDVATLRCDPCLSELKSVEADMFCEDCNQYLCTTCISFHKKFTATMNHPLVDKNTMSEIMSKPAAAYDIFNIDHPIEPPEQTTSGKHSKHSYKYDNTTLKHIDDLNVKTSRDQHDCNITGAEMLTADFLVLVDNNNHAVKILDTRHRVIIAEHTMSSAPWDVAVVEEGFEPEELAVTLPKERAIQFLVLRDGVFSEGRRLKVDGDCRGIAFSHHRLAVTCDSPSPCKVEVIDLHGRLIKSLSKDRSGRLLFKCPQNIAASPDGDYLYVTDRVTCDVMKLTFDDEIVARYDDQALCSPEGIVIASDGTLIVCNYKNNELHLVSPECERLKIVKGQSGNVLCPTAVCYCEQRNKLYVSQYWIGAHPLYVNTIKIFEFELLPKYK